MFVKFHIPLSFAAPVVRDGTFRIEDVPQGNWRLSFTLYDFTQYENGYRNLGAAEPLDFTIPAIPGGQSDVPFDVGVIAVR